MDSSKCIMTSIICQLIGFLIGMALGLGLVSLICKMGWMEKFL